MDRTLTRTLRIAIPLWISVIAWNSLAGVPGTPLFGDVQTLVAQPENEFLGVVIFEDLNGDGVPDVASRTESGLQITLSEDVLQYESAVEYGDVLMTSFTFLDAEQDGDRDIAYVVDAVDPEIRLLENDGNGAFIEGSSVPVTAKPISILTADANGDGDADILVQSRTSPTTDVIAFFVNDGNGNFTGQPSTVTSAGPPMQANNMADLNCDMNDDLILIAANELTVLHGDGIGQMTSVQSIPENGTIVRDLVLVDKNGDQKPDLVYRLDNAIRIWLNDGTGIFSEMREITSTEPIVSMQAEDFDRDGDCDLVVGIVGGSQAIRIYDNDGLGFFTVDGEQPVSTYPEFITINDLNGDLASDIVISDPVGTGGVERSLNDGSGNLGPFDKLSATTDHPPVIIPFDVTDETPGVALVPPGTLMVSFLANDGTGNLGASFVLQAFPTLPNGKPFDASLATQTANADRILAIVGSQDDQSGEGVARVAKVLPNGSLEAGQIFDLGILPRKVETGDFNNDGRADFATSVGFDDAIQIIMQQGDGTFTLFDDVPTNGSFPTGLAIGDVDNDGNSDLVTTNQFSDSVSVITGQGDGLFNPAMTFSTAVNPVDVSLGDINGDGLPDVAIAHEGSSEAGILLNDGAGGFTPGTSVPLNAGSNNVEFVDFDRDGNLDIVLTQRSTAMASVAFGDGQGSFSSATYTPAGSEPNGLAVTDANADGQADIVVSNFNFGPGQARTLVNDGTGASFTTNGPYGTGSWPQSVVVGDVNNDQRNDLIIPNFDDRSVTVLWSNREGDDEDETDPWSRVANLASTTVTLGTLLEGNLESLAQDDEDEYRIEAAAGKNLLLSIDRGSFELGANSIELFDTNGVEIIFDARAEQFVTTYVDVLLRDWEKNEDFLVGTKQLNTTDGTYELNIQTADRFIDPSGNIKATYRIRATPDPMQSPAVVAFDRIQISTIHEP